MMTEGIDRSYVFDVEHGLVVRFDDVVTLPVIWRGKMITIYVGITGLQKLAIGTGAIGIRPSTAADVVDIARITRMLKTAARLKLPPGPTKRSPPCS